MEYYRYLCDPAKNVGCKKTICYTTGKSSRSAQEGGKAVWMTS